MDSDYRPVEITRDIYGKTTSTFRPVFPTDNVELRRIFALLLSHFPDVLEFPYPPMSTWELLDLSEKNGINYFEDSITLTFRYSGINPLLDKLITSLPDGYRTLGFHCLKFKLESNEVVFKTYDVNYQGHNPPVLPPGVVPEEEFGIGVHLNDPNLKFVRDIYFYTYLDCEELSSFFGVSVPDDNTRGRKKRAFSCLYDVTTSSPIVLKQYFSLRTTDFEGF